MASDKLKSLFKKERRVGDQLPFIGHINERTLALRGGMLMQTLLLDGLPFETAETSELNYRLAVRETMLRSVNNSRIALYHHVVRRRAAVDLDASFPDSFSSWLDRRWRNRMSAKRLFVNDLFLTIVYKPSLGKIGLLDRLTDGASRTNRANRSAALDREIRLLDSVREGLTASLKPYGPRTLQRYDGAGAFVPSRWSFFHSFSTANCNRRLIRLTSPHITFPTSAFHSASRRSKSAAPAPAALARCCR